MRDPYQLDPDQNASFQDILRANPLDGSDLKMFEFQARHLLLGEKHLGKTTEERRDDRQKLWTVHILTKKTRGLVAGAILGAALGAGVGDSPDPVSRFALPSVIMSVVVRLVDMKQFQKRAQRAVPEFWDYSKL